uniref:Naphthoate synthase family protein n=1 Tax=Rhizophora mucronata TaxID=61149 RepID=A0A2P2MFA5_RHIMU
MLLEEDMCCTWFVISQLQQITPSLAKLVQRLGVLMLAMAVPSCLAWLDRRKHVKCGF